MLVSTFPQAKANLLAALQAAGPLTGVKITWAGPTTAGDEAPEQIYFLATEFEGTDSGIHRRDDLWTLTLIVMVRKVQAPDVIETRALALVAAVFDVIAADRTLGGVVNVKTEIAGGTVSTQPLSPEGEWQSHAELRVHGSAVITG